jgi:alkylated DNA repair dioxygenase AlkB
MTEGLQSSLFGEAESATLAPLADIRRVPLSHGAWIDVLPNWLTGADAVFERLVEQVPWEAQRRRMYDRVVDVPRLLCFYSERDPLPDPILTTARMALSRHYASELGEPFATAGLCLYRDGRDSVAWHGDTIGRGAREDTMVAILSIGAQRTLLLRPRSGGQAVRQALGPGDLIVMGGSCQRTWQHSIPKTTKPTGPRISVQFRPRGVR